MASKQANAKLALRITGGMFRFVLNVLFYIIVVMCIITFTKTAYNFSYQVFGDVAVDEDEAAREVRVRILKGDSTMTIARKLEQQKIIIDKRTFYLKAKLASVNIKPGTYVVSSAMTYDEIFAQISDVKNSLTKEEYQEEDDSKKKDQKDSKDTKESDGSKDSSEKKDKD